MFSINCWIKSSHCAAQLCHGFFKGPVSGYPKWVNETISILNIIVELVETNIFVAIQATTASQPLTSEEFSDSAEWLQRHVCDGIKVITDTINSWGLQFIQKFVDSFFIFGDDGGNSFWPLLQSVEIWTCLWCFWNFILFFLKIYCKRQTAIF